MIETVNTATDLRQLLGVYRWGRSQADLCGGHVSQSGNICVVDGRIDHLEGEPETHVLALYEKHGVEGLRGLIGDWSLAIRDERRRAVILASDFAGTRPLYYARSADSVVWSTSLEQLSRLTGRRELEPDYVAEYLYSGFPEGVTPYKGIFPVPPGEALTFTQAGVDRVVLWTPPLETTIRYAADTEYEERFRALFEDAVAVRLQTTAPVAAELSGGLDSSSIVCVADRLIRSGAAPASGLITFSYDIAESPDRRYMTEVERTCPAVSPVHLDGDALPVMSARNSSVARPTFAEPRLRVLRAHMEAAGCSVLLTGQFGDLITGNVVDDSGQAADYLRRGRMLAAFRELLAWGRSVRVPVYGLFQRAIREAFGRPAASTERQSGDDSLTEAFRSRARERAMERAEDPLFGRATPSRRKRIFAMREMLASRFFQCPEPLDGFMYSHPFTHRPLVEFMLSVPPALVCRPGEPRRLMRRALHDILPEPIRRRRSKGNYEAMFLRAMRTCAAGLVQAPERMQLAQMGFVDAASAGRRLLRLTQGLECNSGQLRQIILMELWLRQRFQDGDLAEGDGRDV